MTILVARQSDGRSLATGCASIAALVKPLRNLLVVATLLLGVSALAPAGASAEPLCTDTWTGPAEGSWTTAANWSEAKVPGSSSVACIGAGKTAKVSEGISQVGVVQGEGTVAIREATLEVSNTLEASKIKTLTMDFNGKLTGAATVQVSGTFNWLGGTMSGSGSTVVLSGATGTFEIGGLTLTKRSLVNEGTLSFPSSAITMEEGAEINNRGTFNDNTQGSGITMGGTGAAPKVVNTGTWRKTEGINETLVAVSFDNEGVVSAGSGMLEFRGGGTSGVSHAGTWKGSGGQVEFREGTFSLGATVPLEGTIAVTDYGSFSPGAKVSAGKIEGAAANLTVNGSSFPGATLTLEGPGTSTVETLAVEAGAVLTGSATIDVSKSLTLSRGHMTGSGSTVLQGSGTGTISGGTSIKQRTLLNEGTIAFTEEYIEMTEGATIENKGIFEANAQATSLGGEGETEGTFINKGAFEKTLGTGALQIRAAFYNYGEIAEGPGKFEFKRPRFIENNEIWGGENPSDSGPERFECGEGVDCATGNFSQTQADFKVGGRGVGLDLARTYNSQGAAKSIKGAFGYGWSSSFSDHLVVEKTSKKATLVQANGSVVPFTEGAGGAFTAPEWSQDTLAGTPEAGYTLKMADQTVYKFAGASGRLETVTDRNGNAIALTYNEAGRLTTITDPASRTIKLAYNGEGLVESAEDPMKHIVKYTYEGGNLASVTQPAEAGLRWQFKYDGSHQLSELTDGRANKSLNEYNAGHQVIKQTDRLKRETTWEYQPFFTRTTNHATGAVTREQFTSAAQANVITRGYGTSSATTETRKYDSAHDLVSQTDGNGHTTKDTYDSHNNRVSMVDPLEHETKWSYNSTHDIETETKPNGETTTYKRDSHGNPEVVERPAPSSATQLTKYGYDTHGEMTSMEDPMKRIWKYEYNSAGDRTAETDPENDKRTWEYNEDSQETSTVSPRGHVKAGEEAKYTTTTERDAQGRPIKVTDPLKHETKYAYDANGNLETKTDPELHVTTYSYDADNERTKIKEPNETITETGYDGAGQVTSQTDGNKHTTKYQRNVLEQVIEVVDPLNRKTLTEYDQAGNRAKTTDPLKRTTTYKYDAANRVTELHYSDGTTPTVNYEYNADGKRTKMVDGTGTTKYEYDQLDRLTETKDGHGNVTTFEYDLANEQTKITYPNGKAAQRSYDKAARLVAVVEWLGHITSFAYDADSNLKTITFPSGTSNIDTYAYDEADAMKEAKMTKGTETLASLVYSRNSDGQVKGITSKGLPGEEKPAYTYDANSRLTKGAGTEYKYNEGNDPTTIGAEHTYSYDAAHQLEKSELKKASAATYGYSELGERTKTTPATGPATTYGYDQASRLTSVTRPKEGETPAIEDTYSYNGDGLRTSQTISGATTYLAWDVTQTLPLVLSDGANSYIYGPGGLPVEQVSGGGTVVYLHHDQQGSTRLMTDTTGTLVGAATYDAYGNKIGSTGTATTVMGYDGQYTDADTGLIYLRARYYDPATVQFVSVDPKGGLDTIYAYANSDPLANGDPTGESCRPNVRTVKSGESHACGVLGQLFVHFTTDYCTRWGCKADVTMIGIAQRGVTQRLSVNVRNPAFGTAPVVQHLAVKYVRTPIYHEPVWVPTGSVISIQLEFTRRRTREVISVELHDEGGEL